MALLCVQLNYVVVFGQFFFCLVCGLLEKRTKKKPCSMYVTDTGHGPAVLLSIMQPYQEYIIEREARGVSYSSLDPTCNKYSDLIG